MTSAREPIPDQTELLQRIADGDEKAFADLYRAYARRLIGFLTRFTDDRSAAEDIIQITFLKVWLNRDKIATIDNPTPYIFRIAANNAHNWLTKTRRISITEQQASKGSSEFDDATNHQLLLKEASKIVSEAINELPAQRKKIYSLYRDGLTYNEIAQQLNITASTARTAVSKALEHLRERLSQEGLMIFFLFFFGGR